MFSSIHGFLGGGLNCLPFDFIFEESFDTPKTTASRCRAGKAVVLIRNVWMQVNAAALKEAQRAQHFHHSTALSDELILVTRHVRRPLEAPLLRTLSCARHKGGSGALLSL